MECTPFDRTLGIRPIDPRSGATFPHLPPLTRALSPLVWLAEVNGFLVDLRDMPREVQQVAFDKGMIPYITADQEKGAG